MPIPSRFDLTEDTHSLLGPGSLATIVGIGSISSIVSIGSVASIGSIGSVASIGSVGSIASIGKVGAVCNIPVAEKLLSRVAQHLIQQLHRRRTKTR